MIVIEEKMQGEISMQNYQYPIEIDWTHDEMNKVIMLWNAVESAYENEVNREEFLKRYRSFKEVVPSKGEEKRYGSMFKKETGYSLYQVVKLASNTDNKTIKMKRKQELLNGVRINSRTDERMGR